MSEQIVIGIDGGGTYTRAVAARLTGEAVARVETGAASPNKTPHAQENVRRAIRDVVAQAGRQLADVRALAAGLAGLDSPQDQAWAERFTELPGLTCPRVLVNDAVVAHSGALASRPGVIAIAGTGSIIFGVTEEGRQVRNYDFHHYAYAAARHLAYNVVYGILAGRAEPEDQALVTDVMSFWEADDVAALRLSGASGFVADAFERHRRFGELAPLVTAAAMRGSPLARGVCDHAAEALATGIGLVGGCFATSSVSVALIGGAVRSAYMRQAMERALARLTKPSYWIVDPVFSCEAGAVLMALKLAGVPIGDVVEASLQASCGTASL